MKNPNTLYQKLKKRQPGQEVKPSCEPFKVTVINRKREITAMYSYKNYVVRNTPFCDGQVCVHFLSRSSESWTNRRQLQLKDWFQFYKSFLPKSDNLRQHWLILFLYFFHVKVCQTLDVNWKCRTSDISVHATQRQSKNFVSLKLKAFGTGDWFCSLFQALWYQILKLSNGNHVLKLESYGELKYFAEFDSGQFSFKNNGNIFILC